MKFTVDTDPREEPLYYSETEAEVGWGWVTVEYEGKEYEVECTIIEYSDGTFDVDETAWAYSNRPVVRASDDDGWDVIDDVELIDEILDSEYYPIRDEAIKAILDEWGNEPFTFKPEVFEKYFY